MGTGDASAALLAGLRSLSSAASKPLNDAVQAAIERAAAPHLEPAATPEDPADMLNRIALDAELEQGFAPVLLQLGFKIQATEILDQFTNSRTVTTVTGAEYFFYVVCIPKSILEQGRLANLGAVSLLGHLFARKSRLYIISRDLSAMDLVFETMMNAWKEDRAIKADFIPWSYVTKFLGEKSDQKKMQLVKTMLKLEKLPGIATPLPVVAPTALTEKEKADVVKILTQQSNNPFETPQAYYQNLVVASNFPNPGRFAGHWKGDPGQDALLLFDSTENPKEFPIGHPRAGENKLGWLLKALVDQEMSPDDSRTVVKIILDHHLIRDPETAAALQAKYSPSETEDSVT